MTIEMGTAGPACICQVLPASALVVTTGVNRGEAIGPPGTLCLDDIYQLSPAAPTLRLALAGDGDAMQVAPGSEVGTPGEQVRIVARLTLIGDDGALAELHLFEHHGTAGRVIYALPLAPLMPRSDYTLIAICTEPGAVSLADSVCISFARGTRITLGDGRLAPIEALQPGDRILTRDHGAQPLRWIGQATRRATGSFVPVVISAGTLGNSGDLILGQHHRLFLYRRNVARLSPTAEVLVQAKHLVDDDRVFLRPGGVVDYFSLSFDRHEIIYAEGIPAESLLVSEGTLTRLPEDLATDLQARHPGMKHRPHFGTEADRAALDRLGPAALFRQARAG